MLCLLHISVLPFTLGLLPITSLYVFINILIIIVLCFCLLNHKAISSYKPKVHQYWLPVAFFFLMYSFVFCISYSFNLLCSLYFCLKDSLQHFILGRSAGNKFAFIFGGNVLTAHVCWRNILLDMGFLVDRCFSPTILNVMPQLFTSMILDEKSGDEDPLHMMSHFSLTSKFSFTVGSTV